MRPDRDDITVTLRCPHCGMETTFNAGSVRNRPACCKHCKKWFNMSKKKEVEWKDCFGRPIKEGDIVAYGHRDGNSGKISLGKVIELTHTDSYSKKIPKVRVARCGIDHYKEGVIQYFFFKSTIEQLQQLMIINRDSVPQDVLIGLDKMADNNLPEV